MAVIDIFEKDLVNKLNFKASSKVSEEALLLKTFKFFDLDNVGFVPRSQFFRAVAKVGVIISSPSDMHEIFSYYDRDGLGKIDYRKFTNKILIKPKPQEIYIRQSPKQPAMPMLSQSKYVIDKYDNQSSPISKVQQIQYKQPTNKTLSTPQEIIDFIRERLKEEGIDALLDKAVKLKLLDINRTHKLPISKISQVFTHVTKEQLDTALQQLNSYENGFVNYAQLVYFLRGKVKSQRKNLITNIFDRLDVRRQRQILLEQVLARNQDKLRAKQFQKAVEDYCRFQGIDDGVFVDQDFIDFFEFISLSFNDDDFVLYIDSSYPEEDRKSSKIKSKRNYEGVERENEQQIDYRTNFVKKNYDSPSQPKSLSPSQKKYKYNQQEKSQTSRVSSITRDIQMILNRVSKRLSSKGPKGFLSFEKALASSSKATQNYLIELQEFKKIVRDQRIDISQTQCQLIFQVFDPQNSGLINYVQLLQLLKGSIPENRKKLISRVWNQVKQTQSRTSYHKIKLSFQARSHPDIKSAKRYEQQLTRELLQTLMLVQGLNNGQSEDISKEDFIEYMENVSYSIPDDRFFEAVVTAVWRLGSDVRIQEEYAGTRKHFQKNRNMYLQDHHRYLVQGGTVAQSAPFGTYDEPTNYTTQSRRLDHKN